MHETSANLGKNNYKNGRQKRYNVGVSEGILAKKSGKNPYKLERQQNLPHTTVW